MANGDILFVTPGRLVAKLLDATAGSGADNGQWVDCREYVSGSISVVGATGATVVEIDGLNQDTPPANATNTAPIATTTAATDTVISVSVLPVWIKARIKTTGTGTVTALLCARGYPV